MSEWLDLMLGEIRRKEREAAEAARETARRSSGEDAREKRPPAKVPKNPAA